MLKSEGTGVFTENPRNIGLATKVAKALVLARPRGAFSTWDNVFALFEPERSGTLSAYRELGMGRPPGQLELAYLQGSTSRQVWENAQATG